MEEDAQKSDELTAFAPFEAIKDSKLSFKGSTKQPGQIEISDSEAFGFPKVLFRRSRTPTPAGTGEIQRNSNPVSVKTVRQGEKRETRVRIKPESVASSRPPPPRAITLQQPRAQVTKSLVLKRIGNLERNQDPANDLKKYWMPDSACKECSECQTKFNLLIRRHHCRICGRIFCNACCSQTIPGVLLRPDLQGNLRVCIECLEIFQEFHASKGRMEHAGLNSSSQPGGEVSHAPRSVLAAPTKSQLEPPQGTFLLQDSSLMKGGSGNYSRSPRPMSWDDTASIRSPEVEMSPSRMNLEFDNPTPLRSLSSNSVRRQSIAALQPVTSKKDERLLALGEDEVEFTIHEVWFNMMNPITGLQPQNHRYRLRNYPRSYTAHDIVEWLIMQGHSRSRENAVCIGQALVDTKRLKIVSSIDEEFRDESNLFLELGEMASLQPSSSSPMVIDAPKWFQRLPEDGDSEYEVSDRLDSSSMQGIRYTESSRNNAVSTFHKGQNVQEPTIAISSVSELTGGISGSKERKSPVVLSEPEDDYLVIKKDSKYEKDVLSQGGSRESSVSRGDDGSEWGPFLSPSAVKSSQVSGASFSVIDRQEVLEALPVTGLSTATEAAKEFTTESGKGMKSNEEARAVFERDHDNHFDVLIIQLMQSFGLSLSWLSIIKPLITEATSKVKTNIFVNDQMNINQYVKVKKIPGGQKKNSSLVFGAVCSKNVTHKKMSHSIRNPTILLLKCAFEFQRKENQLSDFETLQLQEEKYLKNLVARVDTFKPSIILVQKSVSRLALEMLYELGIVVAVNVKPSVMARVARSTQGDLLHSLDQLFFDVRLGTCGHFYVKNFSLPDGVKKTLMYFDQCDATLGCVITLQGGTKRELKKVKKVTCFGLYISRNSKLETSFLVDEFAWPPSLQPSFLQNTEDYTSTSSTPEWPLYPSLAFPISSISPNELAKKLAVLAPDSDENTPADKEDPPAEQSSDPSGSQVQLDIPNRKKHLGLMLEEEKPQAGMPSELQPLEASAAVETQDDHSPRTDDVLVKRTIPTVSNEVLSHLGEKEFQLAFENQLLSISPNIAFPTPYLQAAQGIAADVRQYLPRVIYWSYQFKVKPPSSNQPDALTSQMEMGLTKSTLQKSVELESLPSHQLSEETQSQPQFTHSYRSVSDHPFTTSVFILKVNMNEMKAALADYRARAGLPEKADCFFFPSARKASDYRLHLQNLFNKYKQFEVEEDSVDSISADLAENEIEVPQKMKNEGAVKLKRRIQRWKAPEGSSSSASQSDHSEEFHQTSRPHSEKSKDVNGKSTSESYRSSVEAPKVSKRRSMEPITESSPDDSLKKSKSSKFGSSKLSETFGTFEDLDHEHPHVAGGDEEEENVCMGTDVTDKWMYEGWMAPYQHVDCLNPINHQGIAILFSSTCHDGQKHQQPCVPPCIIPMNYYGTNDISLGDFLRRYCFRPQYRCQTCGVDMNKHQRHVIHGNSALHIQMQQLQAAIPGSNEEIYTWLACRHCAQCTPYTKMSEDSLLFSFAKFLELRFYSSSYVTRYRSDGTSDCPHLIHKDYIQHFCCKNSIASFQPSPISLMEVCIPPKKILIFTPHSEYHHDYGSEIKHIQRIIEGVFCRIRQKLQQYNMEPVTATIKDYVAGAKAERVTFRNKLKLLKDLVVKEGFVQSVVSMETSQPEGKNQESEDSFDSLQDGIVDLKRKLTEVVECWNINLENTDAVVRAYRSKKDTIMTDGHSPHDTPLPTTDGEGASSGSLIITPKEASISSPGLLHTPNLSPDLSRVASQNTSSSHSDSGHSSAPVRTQATLPQKPRSHSRNLSDSNIQTPAEAAPELKIPTKHKRQLSDSFCAKSSTTTSNSSATKKEEGDGDSKQQPEGEQTATSSPPEDQPSEDTESGNGIVSKDSQSDNLSLTSEGDEGRARDRTEYQRIKTMFSHYNQPLRGDPSDRQSPHLQPGAQGDDTSHTDSSGGIFAKLRGKDADGRDDPTKYYLLDPSEFNSSPHLGAHPAPLELPNPRPHRRPGTVPRKTAVPVATSTTEASGDGKSGERRVVRERTGVLSRPFQKLPPPFDLNEHHNMHGHVSIPVAIYEKEATSIIAYALSSHKYSQELKAMQEKKQNASVPLDPTPPSPKLYRKPVYEPEKPQSSTSGSSKGSSLMAALKKKGSAISIFSGLSISTMLSDPPDPTPDKFSEDPRRHDTGGSVKGREASQFGLPEDELDGKWSTTGSDSASSAGSKHISLEFTTPDKSASFFCKVYFAEEFHRLRQLIFPSGEVRFVRSLARCVKYDAKGGKSRSMFCKVADDRFILKQIKSIEISSFEQFAPQYFEHVNRALEEGRPLVLAKILGAYSIGYRNTKTGNSKRQDVIIMENLLYGHKSAKVFDLKGSMRSRYIDPSKDSSGDVLLDENYLNYIYSCPVYVYPHSKCVLMQAIFADTEFLAQNSIMDYSLLTCIDETSGELVVGIIDYVRTFTLDKRLEMYLKKTAGRVLPTVVWPELYRKRFCAAIERYFTVVPDKWTGFGPSDQCEALDKAG